MKVSIIIVNWNTRELLQQCLQSIADETKIEYEVFVVDNCSSDESAAMVRNNFPAVRLIENESNRGFAAANNQAMHQAKGKYILLLNPDTKILNHAIDKTAVFLDENPDVGLVACKLLNSDRTLQKSVGNFYSFWGTLLENRLLPQILPDSLWLARTMPSFWDHEAQRDIDWARGAYLMAPKNIVEEIGLLDEQFFIYGEEIDWCWRIKQNDWRIVFLPTAKIIHHGKAASEQRRKEMFVQNYKSFYIFLKKHYPRYSYWLYRTRTHLYLILWLLKNYISKLFKKNNESIQRNIDSYLYCWKWHHSRESFIRVYNDCVPVLKIEKIKTVF